MSEPPEGPRELPSDRSTATERQPFPAEAYGPPADTTEGNRMAAELAEHHQAAKVADARERMPALDAAREEIGRHFDLIKQRARGRRRESQVPPPRRWKRVRTVELIECPICFAVVAGIQSGGWHLKNDHDEGESHLDAEAWREDILAEVDEYARAALGARGRFHAHQGSDAIPNKLAAALLGIIAVMAVVGFLYVITHL